MTASPTGRTRAQTVLVLCALALAPAPALGQSGDPEFRASISQTVSAGTNRGLADPAEDPRFSSNTTLNLGWSRATARDSLSLAGSAGINASLGDDAEDPVVPVAPRVALDYARQGTTTRLSLGASLRVDRAEDQDFVLDSASDPGTGSSGDLRLTTEEGLQIDGGLSAGLGWDLGPLDSLNASARVSRTEFVDVSTADGSTDAGASLGWTRTLSPLWRGTLSTGLNQVVSDGENADSIRASLNGSLNYQESDDRSFTAGLGIVVIDAESDDEIVTRFSGNLRGSFELSSRDSLSLGVDQNVTPGADGALVTRTGASADWTREVTGVDTVIFGLGATRQSVVSGDADDSTLYRASVTYRRQILPGANLTAGYTFR
ncbi:MAG: hypothetical protein AAGJ92_06610, partial [Pseudomonadota bacterium]